MMAQVIRQIGIGGGALDGAPEQPAKRELRKAMAPSNPAAPPANGFTMDRLWHRGLDRYPNTGTRYWYLAVAVFVTIILYYELYVAGGVAPLVLEHYKMSFLYFVNILVIANLVGAFGSLAAGLADRWGRANLVTYGLAVTGVLALITPLAPDKFVFGLFAVVLGTAVAVLVIIAAIRLLDEALPSGVWLAYLVLGVVVLVVGTLVFRNRNQPAPTNGNTGRP